MPTAQRADFPKPSCRTITVQLPLFNELYVVDRLLKAVTAIDYPREKLEIQVLDDSTDETMRVAEAVVAKYAAQGFDIHYIHRADRTGFKAGALENGNKSAKGELLAIFDADFVPKPDCLRKLVDFFTDPMVGCAQMRWSHINGDYNLLTRLQTIMLDGHFVVEQTTRNRTGGFFNFNGTAGIWRRQAIEMSGGWQHDTLTEDTDLSFRAQLMGWKFVYLLDEEAPAEIPVEINAFKAQQRRWAKGVMQVGLKLYPRIWLAPLPFRVKLEMFFRLTGNISYPLMIVASFLAVSVAAGALQPTVLSPDGVRPAALVLLVDLGGDVLRFGSLVSRREAHAAVVALAARDGARHRSRVFQCARGFGSAAGREVGICAHAEIPSRRDYRRHLETKEIQTQARSAAAARIGFCGLLPARDCLFRPTSHVGNDSLSAAVLFWLWLHGRNESAANCEWEASRRPVAPVKT